MEHLDQENKDFINKFSKIISNCSQPQNSHTTPADSSNPSHPNQGENQWAWSGCPLAMGSIWLSISFFCLHRQHQFIRVHPCLIEWEVLRNFPHCLTNGEIHQGRRPRDSSIFGQKQHDNSNLDIGLYKENALPRNLSTNLASKLPRIDTKDKNINFYRYINSWIL